jgi:proliferating cell nuclear antigen
MTFKIETKSVAEWKIVVDFLTKLVTKATFNVTSEGISLRAMDASHVAMADLTMPSSAFEKFECDEGQKFTISLDTFGKALNRAGNSDGCTLYSNSTKSLTMSLAGSYSREYSLALESDDIDLKNKMDFEWNAKSSMKSYTFDNVINDVGAVSDTVTIQSREGNLEFLGKNNSAGNKVIAILDSANAGVDTMTLQSDFKVVFSLKYLQDIMSVGKETDMIWLDLEAEKPMRIGFKIGLHSTLDFFLAPRAG